MEQEEPVSLTDRITAELHKASISPQTFANHMLFSLVGMLHIGALP